MTDEHEKIQTAYLAKAKKDRSKIRNEMSLIFGYGLRNIQKKMKGQYPLTDRETEYLFKALKLKR